MSAAINAIIGKYAILPKTYLLTRAGRDPSSQAARLCNWMLSINGQTVVEQNGDVLIYP